MAGNDIHKSADRILWAKESAQRRFSRENADVVCRFLTRLKLENKSAGRIANYADCCIRILKIDDAIRVCDWTRGDIERIHEAIIDLPHANSVKKATLSTVKRLYHFAVHDTIPDKNRGQEYDPLVSWITPGAFRDRYERITSPDLLTGEEMLSLVRTAKKMGGRYHLLKIHQGTCREYRSLGRGHGPSPRLWQRRSGLWRRHPHSEGAVGARGPPQGVSGRSTRRPGHEQHSGSYRLAQQPNFFALWVPASGTAPFGGVVVAGPAGEFEAGYRRAELPRCHGPYGLFQHHASQVRPSSGAPALPVFGYQAYAF